MMQLVGEYLSDYARDFVETYAEGSKYGGRTGYDSGNITTSATPYPGWTSGTLDSPNGYLYSCCTSGVWYMYYLALGINIYQYNFSSTGSTNLTALANSEYWEEVSLSESLPGDVAISTTHSHAELVTGAGNSEHANFGSSGNPNIKINSSPSSSFRIFRLKSTVEVDPSGTVSSLGSTSSSLYTFSNFYFNGIPDGTYSIASTSIWATIINTLASLADYLIGILTYIIRMVIVGWTSIIDRLFSWSINTITTVTVEIEEDGSKVEDSYDDTSVEDLGISGADVDDTTSSSRITLESLFYGEYDLVDINIFDN